MNVSWKNVVCFVAAALIGGEARSLDLRPRVLDLRPRVWDTGRRLSGDNIELNSRDGWRLVAQDESPSYTFQGDAVIENDRLRLLCGTRCGPPLLYSKQGVGQEARRMGLLLLNAKGEPCPTITSMKIVENSSKEASLELVSRSQGGDSARMSIVLGRYCTFVEVRPVENAAALRACARSRFAVMPDFFGDDVLFDARRAAGEKVYVPAENILLNFTGNGRTILMSVWPLGDQEVQAVLGEDEEGQCFEAMELSFDDKSLYFAVLDSPGIWHSMAMEDASCSDKDVATGWKKPFEARWRADFRLPGRTDTWEFESRRRENAVVAPFGQIVWPFWFDKDKAMMRLIGPDYLGVALIYPLERRQNTPLTVYTPVDILRETLGSGPCEYILDREGAAPREPGGGRRLVSTGVCTTTGRIQHFFERGLECKERKIIQDMAEDVKAFNITVRQRLEEYRSFARQLAQRCREEERRDPAVERLAERAEQLEIRLDELFQERLDAMKTPEENVALVEQLKDLTLAESAENLGRYLSVAAQLRALASAQDTLAALCRREVRLLRQELGVMAASDRSLARFAEELRELARQALRNKHYTEGA